MWIYRAAWVTGIVLRLPTVAEVCDGTQDAFLIKVHTDAGLVRLAAISGVEMALWDIAGKACGMRVCDLLGGAFRTRVRAYASVLFPEDPDDTQLVRDTGDRLCQQGYSAVKFGWGGFGGDPRADVALARAARRGVGEEVDLLIDVGLRWDRHTALERARMLAEFHPYWLEAPMAHEPVSAYRELCAASPVRIACETAGGFWESLNFLRNGGLNVILPDVSNVGGVGPWKRVAQMAQVEGAWCVPHNFSTGILTAASLHLVANQPNTDLVECSEAGSPLNTDLVSPALRPHDGYVSVPEGPGLGVELNEQIVARYRVA